MTRWTRKLLFEAAKESNLDIKHENTSIIVKRGSVSIKFWGDGTITRNDVRSDLATNMSVKTAAKSLGLK